MQMKIRRDSKKQKYQEVKVLPTYTYRAVTSTGMVIRNRVEAASKQSLLRALKENNLMPITIEQVAYSARRKKTKKKNIKDIE